MLGALAYIENIFKGIVLYSDARVETMRKFLGDMMKRKRGA